MVALYPASGYRYRLSGAFGMSGSGGYAWSCVLTDIGGLFMTLGSTDVNPTSGNSRGYGFPVRCVQY